MLNRRIETREKKATKYSTRNGRKKDTEGARSNESLGLFLQQDRLEPG